MRKFMPILTLAVLLAACSDGAGTDKLIQMNTNVPSAETVNGTAVPQSLLDAYARMREVDLSKPEQRTKALATLADYVMLAEQARRDNLAAKPDFAADVELARLNALSLATMAEFEQQTPLTDAALKAEYDAQVARSGKVEYDFTGLLFGNESDALKASSDIDAGKPYAQVYDDWRGRAKQAKAFTRTHPDQLPEALSQALSALKPGESAHAPIKTEFGWHVVQLNAANAFTPPVFDQVKEGIRRSLSAKIARQRLDQLREHAHIEYPAGAAPVGAATTPAVQKKN